MKDTLIYLSIIRKRLWLILLMVVSTVGTIIFISQLNPPVYQAAARFNVSAPPPVDVTLFQGFGNYSPVDEIIATRAGFLSVVTGSSVAWDVIDELQLPISADELQDRIVIEEVVQENVQVQSSQLMWVGVQDEDPEMSAKLTETLIKVSLQHFADIRAQPKTKAREFINSELDITRQELQKAQDDLIAFQIENKVGDLSEAISLQQRLIYGLRDSSDQAQVKGDLQQVTNYDQLTLQRETELQDLVNLSSEYASLAASVKQNESTYEFLQEKETEAKLKENETRTLGFIQFIDEVRVPTKPLPRVKQSVVLLGVVVSLVLGVIVAFIWHYVETSAEPLLANIEDVSYPHKPTPEPSS